ncbi:MAG TPA: peroxiredoxin [Candidatus Dormibacteraeota bacterium]|nr:peroxiredoxin [Candidatus Dormibacteraeota bacterium]
MIGVGDSLPQVTLLDDEGRSLNTSALLGTPLVLYFYPKDDTPGCTSEASQFRDLYRSFERKGARIVGVSRDPVASHQKFKAKFKIPFTLLSDTESALCNAVGVLVEKNMYGKKRIGVARATFLFDPKGSAIASWPKVDVDGHAEEVLAAIP